MAASSACEVVAAPVRLDRLFNDPDERLQYQAACEAAQAALICYLYSESRYEVMQQRYCVQGVVTSRESKLAMQAAWDQYQAASARFDLAAAKLKEVVKVLILKESGADLVSETGAAQALES